ncbi:MAG: tRNA dimethylallyltransferase, partial [Actinomycetota bacterium]
MHSVISIVGPTASGKTALSLSLAAELDAEIVNLDAYQIYRGMDIGTAKPTLAERGAIPHHLIDVVDIEHEANVAEFQQWARTAIADINQRNKIAICVGGSGLYVRAVFEDMDFPGTDPDIRTKYEDLLSEIGGEALYAKLQAIAPEVAQQILPGNSRRVVRALEVIELTGSFNPTLPDAQPVIDALRIGLDVERPVIAERIDRRVAAMFEAGWREETQTLADRGLFETRTASRALGYREVAELIAGEKSFEQVHAEISAATYKFSKKQMQW